MTYLIRSMSTTDFRSAYRGPGNVLVPAQQPKPYHIFLRPVDKRAGAYWASAYEAMKFDSHEEAQAEADRINLKGYDIVPSDWEAQGLLTYWDARRAQNGI